MATQVYKWWLRVAGLTAILVFCALSWAKYNFGSIHVARAYYSGNIVETSFYQSEEADDSLDEQILTVEFKNNSPKPITLLAAIAPCHCFRIKGLPLLLQPLSRNQAIASLTTSTANKNFSQQVEFVTDSPLIPKFVVESPETFQKRKADNH